MLPTKCDISITSSGSAVSTNRRRALLTGMVFENNSVTPPMKTQPAKNRRPDGADPNTDIFHPLGKPSPGRQHLHGAEYRARADQRHQLVDHPKDQQPGEDLVRRKACRETDQDDCIEYAEAARDMTDQPNHKSQNIDCENVRITDR